MAKGKQCRPHFTDEEMEARPVCRVTLVGSGFRVLDFCVHGVMCSLSLCFWAMSTCSAHSDASMHSAEYQRPASQSLRLGRPPSSLLQAKRRTLTSLIHLPAVRLRTASEPTTTCLSLSSVPSEGGTATTHHRPMHGTESSRAAGRLPVSPTAGSPAPKTALDPCRDSVTVSKECTGPGRSPAEGLTSR